MASKPCPSCARQLPADEDRCPYCGTDVPDGAAGSQQAQGQSEPTVKLDSPARAAAPFAVQTDIAQVAPDQQPAPEGVSVTGNTGSRLPSFKETAARFNTLADRVQYYSTRGIVICGALLAVILIYISRPVPSPHPLPAGVATLLPVDTSGGPNAQGSIGNAASTPDASALDSDVAAYLEFLQKIDLQRIGLISSFNQALASGNSVQTNFSETAQDLMRDFLAQKPPTVCGDLSNAYFRMLQDQTGMIARSSGLLQTNDPHGAAGVHDAAMPQLVTDAQAADASLTDFCGMQHLNKPFTIQAEPGGPPLSSSPPTAAAQSANGAATAPPGINPPTSTTP